MFVIWCWIIFFINYNNQIYGQIIIIIYNYFIYEKKEIARKNWKISSTKKTKNVTFKFFPTYHFTFINSYRFFVFIFVEFFFSLFCLFPINQSIAMAWYIRLLCKWFANDIHHHMITYNRWWNVFFSIENPYLKISSTINSHHHHHQWVIESNMARIFNLNFFFLFSFNSIQFNHWLLLLYVHKQNETKQKFIKHSATIIIIISCNISI